MFNSVHPQCIMPLPLCIRVKTLFVCHILYPDWLTPIPPSSVGHSCKDRTFALHWTPFSSAAMSHSYGIAQLYSLTPIVGRWRSNFIVSLMFSCGCSRNLSLSHHNVSCLPCNLPVLHFHHFLFFASPICYHTSPAPNNMRQSDCPWCNVHSFPRGSLSCFFDFSALYRKPAAAHTMILFEIRAFIWLVAAEWSLLCSKSHHNAFVVACQVIAWAVATLGLAATLVLNVATSTAELTPALRARVLEMPRLSTSLLLPRWLSGWSSAAPFLPVWYKLCTMRQFLCSASTPWWWGGWPAIALGWESWCPHSLLQFACASSADCLCPFLCTAREVLCGSLALLTTDFVWHQ